MQFLRTFTHPSAIDPSTEWLASPPLPESITFPLLGAQTLGHRTAPFLMHPASSATSANQAAAEAGGYDFWPVAVSIAAGLLAMIAIWLFSRWIGKRRPHQ